MKKNLFALLLALASIALVGASDPQTAAPSQAEVQWAESMLDPNLPMTQENLANVKAAIAILNAASDATQTIQEAVRVAAPLVTQGFASVPVGEYDRLSYTRAGVYVTIEGVGGKFRVVNSVGSPYGWVRHITTDNQNSLSDNRPYIRITTYKEVGRINDDDVGVHQLNLTITTSARTPGLWPWGEMYAGGGYTLEWMFMRGCWPYPTWPIWPHNRAYAWGVGYSPIGGAPDIGVITMAEIYDCDLGLIGFVP